MQQNYAKLKKASLGSTIPMGYSSSFTGKKKQMYSQKAGRVLTYEEAYTIRVTPTASTPPDIETMKTNLNSQIANQNVDGTCDSILLIQGAISDQYKFKCWIAEEQTSVPAGTLIAPLIWAAIIIAIAITAIVIVVAITCYVAFMAIANALIPSKPHYTGGTPENPQTFEDYAEYLSSQNLLYWYVCPQCGAGFGLKSSYPNVADVPAEEKALFEEHKADCLGIPQSNYDLKPLLLWGILGIGLVVFVVYSVPKIIGSVGSLRKKQP